MKYGTTLNDTDWLSDMLDRGVVNFVCLRDGKPCPSRDSCVAECQRKKEESEDK